MTPREHGCDEHLGIERRRVIIPRVEGEKGERAGGWAERKRVEDARSRKAGAR
jgi:hypothetical protein